MRNIVCVLTIVIAIFTAPFATIADNDPKGSQSFRQIPIAEREHGYGRMDSVVIRTQAKLDDFLASARRESGWNNRKKFEDAIKKAKVDFDKEALVLLRHTEGSGSVQVTFEKPTLHTRTLTCKITRKAPEMGTADMAYYCFALAVTKARVNKVKWHVQGKKTIEFSIVEEKSNKADAG